MCNIAGVVLAVLILLAPNPRVGYLLYPINFFVWAYLLGEPATALRRAVHAALRRRLLGGLGESTSRPGRAEW